MAVSEALPQESGSIASLFKDYRPLALFALIALILCLLGFIIGIPVIVEFVQTGQVSKLPSALLAVALIFIGTLSLSSGLVLDTVVKGNRKDYEMYTTLVYERYRKHH